uniref:MULE transposase domain-containing protein n=1 Tax=Octopus bimaculoides TaxID=37653 RepID=A0A0L8GLB2_OCTBM
MENTLKTARLHTDENYKELKKIGIHNYASTVAEVNAKIIVSNIKVKSISSRDAPRSIFTGEVQNLNDCIWSQIPPFAQLNKNIRRWRQADSNYPATPLIYVLFSIPSEYSYLDNEETFLQYDSVYKMEESKRILIFTSDEALRQLKQHKNWAADGPFKCCSSVFFQLYILHIQIDNFNAPRLFALLSDKSQDTYSRLFAKINELLQNEGPDNIIMDFEKAAYNGLLESLPGSYSACCLLHLGQNVYKHVVQEGLKYRYHEDGSFSCLPAG